MRGTCLGLCLMVVVSGSLSAAGDHPTGEDETAILGIVHAVENGWEQADGGPFRTHFLDFDGARYFESGGENVGLDDLIDHHVEPEGKALDLNLGFTDPQIHIQGDFAWVLFDTEIKATIHGSGEEIHNKGHETMILQKIDGHWKVLHTHSSSRAVSKNPDQHEGH